METDKNYTLISHIKDTGYYDTIFSSVEIDIFNNTKELLDFWVSKLSENHFDCECTLLINGSNRLEYAEEIGELTDESKRRYYKKFTTNKII